MKTRSNTGTEAMCHCCDWCPAAAPDACVSVSIAVCALTLPSESNSNCRFAKMRLGLFPPGAVESRAGAGAGAGWAGCNSSHCGC